jgi:carbon storage regulator
MLVLSRKQNEKILIDGDIRITVVGIRGNQVRIGIEAPGHVGVYREELRLAQADGTKEASRRDNCGRELASRLRACQGVMSHAK